MPTDYRDAVFQEAVQDVIARWAECKHNEEHTLFDELSPEECDEIGVKHYGAFWHVYRCRLCGKVEANDSSG